MFAITFSRIKDELLIQINNSFGKTIHVKSKLINLYLESTKKVFEQYKNILILLKLTFL